MQKSDIGFYGYASTQPHAVSSVSQLSGDAFSTKYNKITYNSFNSVAKAELSAAQGGAVTNTYTLTYGPNNQRRISNSDGAETIYFGLYEVRSNGDRLHYIPTPDGLCGLIVTKGTMQTNYYLHNDHLGSLVAAEAQNGTLTEFSYDPWGRRRKPTNWNDYAVTASNLFTRGFTGHEHMDAYGLINMNGRVYDPRLGRMLSPDNNIQAPDFSQSFNRYSYCLNNPLMFTDPTGEKWWHWVLALSSPVSYIAGAIHHDDLNPSHWDWEHAYYVGGVSSNSEGSSIAAFFGYGWDPNMIPTAGYDTELGPSAGVSDNTGQNHSYYPTYNYKAPEQNANKAYDKTISEYREYAQVQSNGGGDYYVNQYGNPSATLDQFSNNYKGKTENQIVFGQSSFLGYKFPNDINKKFRFVSIGSGREVDMIHFMVVGRRGYMLGYANEIKQAFSFSSSAFYPQDLYSNKLGINFFDRYGSSIQQNPTKISEYINWYLSNPNNW